MIASSEPPYQDGRHQTVPADHPASIVTPVVGTMDSLLPPEMARKAVAVGVQKAALDA